MKPNIRTRRILNHQGNPYVCRECKKPLHIVYVDFIGVTILPMGLYEMILSCPERHNKTLYLYMRDGDWISTQIFRPLTQKDFYSQDGIVRIKPDVHNIPMPFFHLNSKVFDLKSKIDAPIPQRFQVIDVANLIEASERYCESVRNDI